MGTPGLAGSPSGHRSRRGDGVGDTRPGQTDGDGRTPVQNGSGQKVQLEPRQPPGPDRETIAAAASDPRR